MKKNWIYYILFYFLQRTLYRLFPKIWRRNTWKQIRTEELVGKTWTPQLLLFLWSLLVRVNFIFIFFFFSPSYLSLSFASFFYHYFDQPQAFLKLLWRRSDNTIHSLFYLAMALSSFRIEKIFLNFDFFLPNNLHSFILGKLKHFLKWFLYFIIY